MAVAQESVVKQINSTGTFDHWSVRQVKESGIIGGKYMSLYEFYGNPTDTVRSNDAFVKPKDYLWRTNNVLATVFGVTKGQTAVFPEKRGDGYCARIENLKTTVAKTNVVVQGCFFLGDLPEPVKDMKNPMLKILYGIPFQGRPSALVFDYKTTVGNPVMNGNKVVGGEDWPVVQIYLQKRWTDSDGTIHALRVGTGVVRFTQTKKDWVNGYRLEVKYGDITKDADYVDYMGLLNDPETAFSAKDAKGNTVQVFEEGWASADTEPNYLIINFLASCREAYYGAVGNKLWIDNVVLEM
ncbi:MAG: PCMD domain-containing protein [Bacteroidales bacterium]|nr:PCMD domain-containing protein [Bacteroidales bacterium]